MSKIDRLEEEIKILNKTIRKQDIELRGTDKIKADFLNVTSHELKTPLTPIKAYLDLLLKERLGELGKPQKDALEIIHRNTDRLENLIGDILDLTRLESGNIKFDMREIQLADILENVIKDIESLAKEKNIVIESKIDRLPLIEGDEARLTQVFYNLLDNAIKFTPKGKVTVEAKRKGYTFLITVSDTGIGIPKKYLDKIFEKFFQVDSSITRKYKGTGLGLTICRGIVNAHGGSIRTESEPGQGSTFYVELPYKSMGKPTDLFVEEFKENGEAKK